MTSRNTTINRDPETSLRYANNTRYATSPEARSKRSSRKVGNIVLGTLAAAGSLGLAFKTLSAPGPTLPKEAHVATLVDKQHQREDARHGVLEVTIAPNGNIYDALAAVAKAEGQNPDSKQVAGALTSESNQIQAAFQNEQISSQSDGEVTPGSHFDVAPTSKIVDPNALQSSQPGEVITKIS